MDEKDLRELNSKLDAILIFLEEHDGKSYKMYNHMCPGLDNEPDSDIIEYAEDVKEIINRMALPSLKITEEDLPF